MKWDTTSEHLDEVVWSPASVVKSQIFWSLGDSHSGFEILLYSLLNVIIVLESELQIIISDTAVSFTDTLY